MIPLNAIKDDLQSRLNKAGTLQFILHTHTGKFVRAVKASVNEIDRKINGLVTLTSSDVETVQTGIDVASMTLKIDFVIRCKDDEDDVYDQKDSAGFINLFGLPIHVKALLDQERNNK